MSAPAQAVALRPVFRYKLVLPLPVKGEPGALASICQVVCVQRRTLWELHWSLYRPP